MQGPKTPIQNESVDVELLLENELIDRMWRCGEAQPLSACAE